MGDLIQIGIDVKTNIKQATADLDKMGGSVVNNIRTIDRLEVEIRQLNKALDTGRVTEAAYRKGMQQINGELLLFQQRAAKAAQVEKKFGAAAAGGGKNLNRFNMTLQQGGYQLQDFIVQLQGGTSFFTAFSQQGSQFASIFGPKGAVIGAVIALGSAIGATLVASIFNAKGEVKDFSDQLKETESVLSDYFNLLKQNNATFGDAFEGNADLVRSTSQAAKDLLSIAKIRAFDSIKDLAKSLADANTEAGLLDKVLFTTDIGVTGELLNLDTVLQGNITTWKGVREQVNSFISDVRGISSGSNIDEMYKSAIRASDGFKQYVDVSGEMTEQQKKFWEELSQTILQLEMLGAVTTTQTVGYRDLAKEQEKVNDFLKAGAKATRERNSEGRKTLIDLKSELALTQEISKSGKDSVEVARLRAEQEAVSLNLTTDNQKKYVDLKLEIKRVEDEAAALTEESKANQKAIDAAAKAAENLRKELAKAASVAMNINVPAAEKLANLQAQLSGYTRGLTEAQVRIQTAARNAELSAIKAGVDSAAELANISAEAAKIERETIAAEKALDGFTNTVKKAGEVGEDSLSDAEKAALDYAKSLDNQVIGAIGGVADAWSDFVVRGFNDFKGFVSSVLDSFKSMIANMIAIAAKNRIMLSLGIGGIPTSAMAGAGMSGGSLLGMAGGGLSGLAGSGGILGAVGGISSGLGGILSGGGLGASFANLGGLLSGSVGGLGAIGAAIPAIGLIAVGFSALIGKTKELDSGLKVTVSNMDALVETFSVVQKSRLFGLIKSTRSNSAVASAEVSDPITQAVSDIQSNVVTMANVLGVGSDAFSDFSYQFQLSLKGLSEEEALIKIQKEFLGVSDAMAELVPELENFAYEGESATQTLSRLASDLNTVNSAFSNLGRAALSASASAAAAASRLVSAAGGQGAFTSKTQTLVSNILDPSEQLDFYQKKLVGESQFGYVPSEQEVKRIFKSGSMEELETLYGGETIDTLNTIFGLQNQIAQAEEQRLAEQQRAEAAAAAAAAAARKERQARAAAEQQAIADERLGLQKELLELQGNITELRKLELEALDPTNRALQQMIWNLEDAKEAAEGISEVDFATLFDFQKAVAMARINQPANISAPIPMPMVINGPSTLSNAPSSTNEGSTVESDGFVRQSLVELIKYSKRTSDTLRKFDFDGLPPERT